MAESCIKNERKTFDEAVQICFEKGGRLCSRNEMNDCCGKTACDRTQVWVGDEMAGNAAQTTTVRFNSRNVLRIEINIKKVNNMLGFFLCKRCWRCIWM